MTVVLSWFVFFFFVKQKTAYELRISDWSSDVCSSDLQQLKDPAQEKRAKALMEELRCLVCQGQSIADSDAPLAGDMRHEVRTKIAAGESPDAIKAWLVARSEEHTSELQSLMRISYAVFCLKKKTTYSDTDYEQEII